MDRIALVMAAVAAALAVYPLVVYPVLVRVAARVQPRAWKTAEPVFDVAHVIAVHNEGRRIRQKIENALAIRYPNATPNIIVASDGSTDESESIVAEFAPRGVRWLGCERRGKEHAQLTAVRSTSADVIVFSDASTILEVHSVMKLLEPFADPEVGATSGRDIVAEGDAATGEDLYVGYEMELRRAESLAGSLVGLSGCFFASRREVAEKLKDDVPSDLGAALVCLSMGLRAVHVEEARCVYTLTPLVEKEFSRKRRTALRGLRGLMSYRTALRWTQPVRAWQLASHKVLRFLSPVFALVSAFFVGVAALLGSPTGLAVSAITACALTLAGAALVFGSLRRSRVIRAAGFVLLSNAAVIAALFDLLRGREAVHWAPTSRSAP